MIETLQNPNLEKRAVARAIEVVAPPQMNETVEDFSRRVAEMAVRYFEIELDLFWDEQRKPAAKPTDDDGFYHVSYRGHPGVGYRHNGYWAILYHHDNPLSDQLAESGGTGALYAVIWDGDRETFLDVREKLPI